MRIVKLFQSFQVFCQGSVFYKVVFDMVKLNANPANIYLLKVNNRNTRRKCEICSKLTIKTPDAFIINFKHISHLFLVFILLTLNM